MKKKVLAIVMTFMLLATLSLSSIQVFAGVSPYEAYNFAEPDDYEQDEVNEFHTDVLKFEGTDQSNVGGTFDGAWLEYDGFSFGDAGAVSIRVNYCNNSGRCAADSQIEVWIDGTSTAKGGTKVATVDIPATGGDWNTYVDATATLDQTVTGDHDVYMVLVGSTSETNPFIANLRVFEFVEGEAPATTEPTGETTPEATEEATATPEPTEEPTVEPTEEPTATPEKTEQSATTAPAQNTASATATQSGAAETPENDSTVMIVVIVVIVVVVIAAVVSFVVLKKKK